MHRRRYTVVLVAAFCLAASVLPGSGGPQATGPDGVARAESPPDPALVTPQPLAENQLVQRFAPVLKFDGNYKGLPMSAEAYFLNMLNVPGLSPVIAGNRISWRAESNPAEALGRVWCCGRDDCKWNSLLQSPALH